METFVVKDGTTIFFKDWGPKNSQPLFFHHGWPLSADDWDSQMMFFLEHGFRVIAHDRRGHGRSTQTFLGHDMDTYAADVAELVEHLDLKNSVHIGHSTGGSLDLQQTAALTPPISLHQCDLRRVDEQESITAELARYVWTTRNHSHRPHVAVWERVSECS